MARINHFDGVGGGSGGPQAASELPPFDIERLRSKTFFSRMVSFALEHPRLPLALLRRFWPTLKIGNFLLVTKNADVREILERQAEFETPYGPKMTEIAGGTNFILGMQDGPAYRRMKSSVLSAFPVDEVEAVVRPIAARHSQEIMLRAAPGFDVVRDLLRVVPVRICRDYYGMVVDDESEFADWLLALSSLLFSDPTDSPVMRELALVAADRMTAVIDRSIEAIRDGEANGETPLARLVAMLDRKQVSLGEIHSIMLGMLAGFMPTNLLQGGNCLDVVLSRPEAQEAVEAAVSAGDDKLLDKLILEAMRFKPIWVGPFRRAASDAVIAKGTRRERLVKAGTTVMPATLSAMFDPEAVQNPEMFDVDRPKRDYLVFGHGIHLCIGSAIARVEIAENFRALFARKGVRRVSGKAGRLTRLGAYPDSVKVDFEPSPLSKTVTHSMVTIVCEIKPGVSPVALREKVDGLGNPCKPEIRAALDSSGVIHFASLAIAGDATLAEGPQGNAHLVLEISGDGTDDAVIDAFAKYAGPYIREIIAAAGRIEPQEPLQQFMRKHAVKISPSFGSNAGLVFSGTPGHSVDRIRAEAELEKDVRAIIEEPRANGRSGAGMTLAEIRRRLQEGGKYSWAFEPAESLLEQGGGSVWSAVWATLKAPAVWIPGALLLAAGLLMTHYFAFGFDGGFLRNLVVGFSSLVVALIGLVLIVAVLALFCFLALRRLEKRDVPSDRLVDIERLEEIISREDRTPAQNHLTGLSAMKPGLLRWLALRLTFYLISISAVRVFRPGFLSNINTIHFARWVLLPGTDKLMFFSNYGGSWESYLEDFVTKAHAGLTGVWSNTHGFPKTTQLFQGGATDGDRFKRWARLQQVPTLFWYSAYPELNTGRIRINSKIRHGIANAKESDAPDWLSLFGSMPRPSASTAEATPAAASLPVETLEAGDIQSIFFGAFGPLRYAAMTAIGIPAGLDRAGRKAWLEFVTARVSFGNRLPLPRAMTVAFGPDGLARLGLAREPDHDPLKTFPLAFRLGMGSASRSRILDDVGESAPGKWEWGSPEKPVDAVVVCYAIDAATLRKDIAELERQVTAAGMTVVAQLPLMDLPEKKPVTEHFGFVDGVSQPIVKGTPRANLPAASMHLVAPGEFLFGYRDEHGFYPPTPAIRASRDRAGILAELPAADGAARLHDFGRNGTFLVMRQFEQHVDEFRKYCASEAAKKVAETGDSTIDARWIAAKMIGRWPDGTSLVRNPSGRENPNKRPDNDFSFGKEDPQGLRCPLGAHIRRSNPRDSLGEDHETQIRIGKRHRILRVGRPYEKKRGRGKKPEKGLLFMCLNADIERQYEFMQQTWVSAGSFHGLSVEKDPTIGSQNGCGRFSIPAWDGGMVLNNIPDFVTTRGGGYFFMPSRSAMRYLISRL